MNGRPLNLVVDTAAKTTLIHYESVGLTDAHIREVSKTYSSGAGFGGRALPVVTDIKVGDKTVRIRAGMMNLNTVQAHYGKEIDGLLGYDFLHRFDSFTIDFKNNVLVLR